MDNTQRYIKELEAKAAAYQKAANALRTISGTEQEPQTNGETRRAWAPRGHTGGARRKASRPKGPGTATPLILKVLKPGKFMSTREVYDALRKNNWETDSKNPMGLVGVTLGYLVRKGTLARTGNEWHLAGIPEAEATPEIPVHVPAEDQGSVA